MAADRRSPSAPKTSRAILDPKTNRFCGRAVVVLDEAQERIIRDAWADGASQAQAAYLAGVTIDVLKARLRDQLADLPKRLPGSNGRNRPKLPTPEEIAASAALVRQRWTPARWLGFESDQELADLENRVVDDNADEEGLA